MIETDFLQVIKQSLLGVPETMDGVRGQFPQRRLPFFRLRIWELERAAEAIDQIPDVMASFLLSGCSLFFGRRALGSSDRADGGCNRISAFVGSFAFSQLANVRAV